MRLDQAVAARHPSISRRKARELIAAGQVFVNDRPVRVSSRDVSDSDTVIVRESLASFAPLAISDEWIAFNKPAGLPTQPVRGRADVSLAEILLAEYRTIYVVHRLDTPVSGVVLFARSAEAAAKFSRLFANGEIRKTYLARVEPPILKEMTIDSPIHDKDALTIVRPREGNLVEVEIKTGRKHQIRIHLASVGHPVIGDRRYGSRVVAPRLMLHAWKLEHAELGVIEAPSAID